MATVKRSNPRMIELPPKPTKPATLEQMCFSNQDTPAGEVVEHYIKAEREHRQAIHEYRDACGDACRRIANLLQHRPNELGDLITPHAESIVRRYNQRNAPRPGDSLDDI